MLRLTDKTFKYDSSDNTDIRKRFKRIERERKAREAQRNSEAEAISVEQAVKIRMLRK